MWYKEKCNALLICVSPIVTGILATHFFILAEKRKRRYFFAGGKAFSEGFCVYYHHQFSGISEPSGDTGDISVLH